MHHRHAKPVAGQADLAHALADAPRSSVFADYVALTKPRLNLLVVVTSAAGYYLGTVAAPDLLKMAQAVIGTTLVAGGSAVLNQVYERDTDARMRRTRLRPLPDKRIAPPDATIFGLALGTSGVAILGLTTNWLAAALALATLAIYLLIYTPMKRTSSLSTLVGAVPGALPAVIGWSAARGDIAIGGWTLFAIVFLWQIPHFMAIAWMYRDDYRSAGFPMLPVVEPDGVRTGRQALLYSLALLPVSIGPSMVGLAGWAYFWIALVLGVVLLGLAAQFARVRARTGQHTPCSWGRSPTCRSSGLRWFSITRGVMSVHDLPALNATLNGLAGVELLIGYILIRRGHIQQHRAVMIAAFVTSSLFLVSYLVYHAQVGSVRFTRTGFVRPLYYTILITHVTLAATVLPLAIITLSRGLKARYDRHRRIAVWTFPIWMYVSVTGVLVYVLLYQPTWLL